MVESTRITTERPNLSIVFGALSSDRSEALLSALGRAEECLLDFRDSLAESDGSWQCDGTTLDTYPWAKPR